MHEKHTFGKRTKHDKNKYDNIFGLQIINKKKEK